MSSSPTEVHEGDLVTYCGIVSEYYEMTEIQRHFPESMVIESSGNPDYGYTDVTTAEIAPLDGASEAYEGQLVRVYDATVTFLPDAYGIWSCRDASAPTCCSKA